MNYGSIGGTIGHELTHGFDDEGRQFDAKGNLEDWWTAADAKQFTERADCVVNEFNGFVGVDNLHVNGKLTLGENLADLGGLKLAFLAYLDRAQKRASICRPKGTAEYGGLLPISNSLFPMDRASARTTAQRTYASGYRAIRIHQRYFA